MGSTHFLTKTLDRVSTEMSLHVLAYNMKRAINLLGVKQLSRRSNKIVRVRKIICNYANLAAKEIAKSFRFVFPPGILEFSHSLCP